MYYCYTEAWHTRDLNWRGEDVNKLQALFLINKEMSRGCSLVTASRIKLAMVQCVWIIRDSRNLNQAAPCNYYYV